MIHFDPLPQSVQTVLMVLAFILLMAAAITYITALKRPVDPLTPRPISWIGWSLMMGVGLLSDAMKEGWQWNEVGLAASVVGCFIITILSFKNGTVKGWDILCLFLGIISVGVYIFTKNIWITTSVAITGDFIIAIPTQHNAYKDPLSEKTIAWWLGAAAYVLNTIVCIGSPIIYALFPIYLLIMNLMMMYWTSRKVFKQVH